MKPYVFSVQYIDSNEGPEVVIDRGIMFGESYSDIAREIEKKKKSIVDLYIVAIEKETIHLSETSYDKLLNGETV